MTASPQEGYPNHEEDEVKIPPPEELSFVGFSREGLKEAIIRVRLARYGEIQAA
jgi:hypothetical protein